MVKLTLECSSGSMPAIRELGHALLTQKGGWSMREVRPTEAQGEPVLTPVRATEEQSGPPESPSGVS
jgi:hypothetical protein